MELELMESPEQTTKLGGNRILTKADINSSNQLRKLGAMVGDEVTAENSLVRNVSTVPDGEILLRQDIESSPNLQSLGAEEGDIVRDGKLLKAGENDQIRNFMYGYDNANTLLGDTIRFIGSEVPDVGKLLTDVPDDQFEGMTPQERRDLFLAEKQRELDEKYADFVPDANATQLAGGVVGTLLDPTSLLPVGQGIKAASGIGALLGASAASASDLAKTGEIDPLSTAGGAVLGGVAGGAISALPTVARGTTGAVKKLPQAIRKVELKGKPKEIVDKFKGKVRFGTPFGQAVKETAEETNVSPAKVREVAMNNSDEVAPPQASTLAREEIDQFKVSDPVKGAAVIKGFAQYLDSLRNVVTNISPKYGGLLERYDATVALKTGTVLKNADPFMKSLRSMPQQAQEDISLLLFNNKFKDAVAIGSEYVPDFAKQAAVVKRMLRDTAKRYEFFEGNPEYFPRTVKDYKGLVEAMGKEYREGLTKRLDEEARFRNKTIETLTAEQRTKVINKYFIENPALARVGKAKGSFQGERTLDEVPPEYLQFYATPEESLSLYLRQSVAVAERNKIFGMKPNGDTDEDIADSFGKLVSRDLDNGVISPEQADELRDTLIARFTTGERNTEGWAATIRDLGYATTIANPISAIVNLQDLATTMAIYGFKNTIKAMFDDKTIKLKDFAMDDNIASEFMDFTKSARIVSNLFKASGFRAVDSLAKETTLNASFKKFSNMARTEAGRNRIRKEYGQSFGNQFGLMLSQLEKGQVTPLTKMLTVMALSRQQPVFRSNNSVFWNKNPNMRIMYLLKQFMLTQVQKARDATIKEYKSGNKGRAVKNAAYLAGYLSTVGVGVQSTKDMLLGKEIEADEIPDNALWALLGTYGLNEYLFQRYLSQGDISGALGALFIPAMPLFDAVAKGAINAVDPDTEVQFDKLVRPLPIVGPLAYSLFGGGMEKANSED